MVLVDHQSQRSDGGAPDGAVALAAGAVDGPHPVDGLADAAARPVEGRRAHVPGLLLPLAVCTPRTPQGAGAKIKSFYPIRAVTYAKDPCTTYVPGGVAQQRLRSSTCSTSSPRSHAPSDTSSLANRCRIGLQHASFSFAARSVSTHTWMVSNCQHGARLCARTGRSDVDVDAKSGTLASLLVYGDV